MKTRKAKELLNVSFGSVLRGEDEEWHLQHSFLIHLRHRSLSVCPPKFYNQNSNFLSNFDDPMRKRTKRKRRGAESVKIEFLRKDVKGSSNIYSEVKGSL